MTRVLRLIGALMIGLACGTEQPTAPSAIPALTHQLPSQPPKGLPLANPLRPTFSAAHSITP